MAIRPPKTLREREVRRDVWWRVGRWLMGGEWNGRPKTNATWWRFATKQYAWSERVAGRWWSYPRVLRAVLRWLALTGGAAVAWAWSIAPTVTSWTVAVTAWLVLGVAGWGAVGSLVDWPHRRRWTWPAQQVLVPILGYPERTHPRRFLHIGRNFARAGGWVGIAVPPSWVHTSGDDAAKTLVVATRKVLSLADVEESWHVAGRNHFLILAPKFRPPVPGLVPADDPAYVELMGQQSWSAPLLGLGAGSVPVESNFQTDDPHMLVNGQSNSGKSRLLEGMAAQELHQGWDVWVMDYKFTSLDSLRGLVTYRRELEDIHLQLVALGKECERRNRVAEAAAAAGLPRPEFQPLGVFIEEINTTCELLQLWWDTQRKGLMARLYEQRGLEPDEVVDRYGDPDWKISPAKVAIRMGLSMGRERRIHLIAAAQHATTRALGGPEIREQFSLRLMGRATAKAWGMLADEVAHPPVGSHPRGRWHLVKGSDAIEFQAGLWTPQFVRAYATSGGAVAWSRSRAEPSGQDNPARPVAQTATDSNGSRGNGVELVTLKEASDDEGRGLVSMTHHMLRRRRFLDPAFPKPTEHSPRKGVPHRYHPDHLAAYVTDWNASRGKGDTP